METKPIDTSKLGPIKVEADNAIPYDRRTLLERVNKLNMNAKPGYSYWTCVVLYNTVIWRRDAKNRCVIFETYRGVL